MIIPNLFHCTVEEQENAQNMPAYYTVYNPSLTRFR